MSLRHAAAAAAAAASLIAFAPPAAAQNSAADPPVVNVPPPTKSEPPPPRDTDPPAPPSEPVERTVRVPEPVIVPVPQPMPQTVPMEPVTISPDAAYPNGFADPADPFANDMSLSYRQQERGFPWGLLGLLGLLGLIPLFRRGDGYGRTVYVERDEAPRRVVRRDRIDDDV